MRFSNTLCFAALIAHLPMLLDYCGNTWKRGHYQFFPLLMAVVGWLIYDRLSSFDAKPAGDARRLIIVFLAIDIGLLILSILLFSPFFIIPAAMMLIASYVTDRYGWAGFKSIIPVWLILIFIIPIPGNLDVVMIQKMQFLASQLASWILDALGQIHFREGVILVTEKKQFLTEEACSGIRSLFSSLAAISIYGVVRHYSLWRLVFNLAQTIVWVLVGNAIRVALVVYLADNWTDAIASGTNHEMLGLGVFVLIFVLSLSTDRAINAIFMKPDSLAKAVDFTIDSFVVQAPSENLRSNPAFRYGLVVVFVILCLLSTRLYYVLNLKDQDIFYDASEFAAAVETDMPEEIEGWKVAKFDYQSRGKESIFAPESYIWEYTKDGKRVTVSLDGPYPEFHNLAGCYSVIGWDTICKHEYSDDHPNAEPKLNRTVVDIEKNGDHGVVIFSVFDRTGKLVVPNEGTFSFARRLANIANHLKLAFGIFDRKLDMSVNRYQLPISQVQVLYISGNELTQNDHAEIGQLFLHARSKLLETDRFVRQSN